MPSSCANTEPVYVYFNVELSCCNNAQYSPQNTSRTQREKTWLPMAHAWHARCARKVRYVQSWLHKSRGRCVRCAFFRKRKMLPLRLPLTRSAEISSYSCTFCSFRSSNGIEYVKHLFQAHSFESNFWYMCGISSCTHVFTTGASFDAFCGHCTRKHHNWQNCFIPTIGVEEVGPGIDSVGPDIHGCTLSCSDTSTGGIETGGVSDDCSSTDQDME